LLIHEDGETREHRLGPDNPQVLVPAGAWQAAEPRDGWALVSCVVTPGFDFAGFELAAPGWSPA
jgi:predicted cupin superfamily sugar epimerase